MRVWIKYIEILLLSIIFIMSCSRVRPEVVIESPGVFEVDSEGGKVELKFRSSSDWEIELSPDTEGWIALDRTAGSAGAVSVDVSVEENYTGETREAVFSVVSGGETYAIFSMTQESSYLVGSDQTFSFGYQGGVFEYAISHFGACSVDTDCEWISYDETRTETSLVFSVHANDGEARIGNVMVSCAGKVLTARVEQEAYVQEFIVEVSQRQAVVGAEGAVVGINMGDEEDYSVDVMVEWISPVEGKDVEKGIYYFDVRPNAELSERSGMILLCGNMSCRPFTIIQKSNQ